MKEDLDHKNVVLAVAEVSLTLGLPIYVVGGVIRDVLRGSSLNDLDLDFVVEGSQRDVFACAEHMQGCFGGTVRLYERFSTAKVVDIEGLVRVKEIDFAMSRSEIYSAPGALPKVSAAKLSEDLFRRDFSINAMAVDVGTLSEV
ncbi:MAG: hypothetical protein KDD53_10570, partial [Bdellovibrionales bacterium]|nr:hypothetical protein [Bdellovibrionales bacterium]